MFGNFGENLTTRGLTKNIVHIGDQFRVGSAILQATQPRMPCCKPGIRFDRPRMLKRFWRSGRRGICNSVVDEGALAAVNTMEKIAERPNGISVAGGIAPWRAPDAIWNCSPYESPDLHTGQGGPVNPSFAVMPSGEHRLG